MVYLYSFDIYTIMTQCPIKVSYTLTPYDLTILVLIYMYVFEGIHVPLKIFLSLIPEYEDTTEELLLLHLEPVSSKSIEPVLPYLKDIIKLLETEKRVDIAKSLLGHLQNIDGLEVINNLVWVLDKECLLKSNKNKDQIMIGSVNKLIAKKSVLGVYIRYCFKKYICGGFEEREDLWNSFVFFRHQFLKDVDSLSYRSLDLEEYKFQYFEFGTTSKVVLPSYESQSDLKSIELMKKLIKKTNNTGLSKENTLIVSPDQLHNYINWEVSQVYFLKTKSSNYDNIFDNLTLHDITRFPAIFFIRYLNAVNENRYQDALDFLHNYFDYTLTQSSENCYHISLLYLATFHASFGDANSALKAFEEATKIARENKDTSTLNVIMIWVINFLEKYPIFADRFYVTVDQIIKYLKSSSDTDNAVILKNAYRFDSIMQMYKCTNAIDIFESTLKYMTIVFQSIKISDVPYKYLNYASMMWRVLGQRPIADIYEKIIPVNNNDGFREDILHYEHLLEKKDYTPIGEFIERKKKCRLTFQQTLELRILEVRYLVVVREYWSAIEVIESSLVEFSRFISESKWQSLLEFEKARILIECKASIRAIPLIQNLYDRAITTHDPYFASKAVLLLVHALAKIGKLDESRRLFTANLGVMYQFNDLDDEINRISNVVNNIKYKNMTI